MNYTFTKRDQTYVAQNGERQRLYAKLKSIRIQRLKGLCGCEIEIDKPLIALMGVNGVGKTTIIHALACCFRQDNRSDTNDRVLITNFKEYFPPSPDATWKDSDFSVTCDLVDNSDTNIIVPDYEVIYGKSSDRWTPRSDRRPIKDSIYIGVSDCDPAIESFKKGKITYKTSVRNDKDAEIIRKEAAVILNKDYIHITDNTTDRERYLGVTTGSNLSYMSLSMGAGEQRVFKILHMIHNSPKHSLILIDEIDLLMHSSALKRLIRKINEVAMEKSLQIVFTTHSLVMNELKDCVSIKYLDKNETKTLVYNDITTLAWDGLTGSASRPIKIYVEDNLSRHIVKNIASSLNMKKRVDVRIFGCAENAFTLAAAKVITGEDTQNDMILLDGDVYRTEEEKLKQIKKVLGGTEADADEKRKKAVSIIKQYDLPNDVSPEGYLYKLIGQSMENNEIIEIARRINAVEDKHEWIYRIAEEIDESSEYAYTKIVDLCSRVEGWNSYTLPIRQWLMARKDI